MMIYISGPMTGLPAFNYPAFFEAARELEAAGHEPLNPARWGPDECDSWKCFMQLALMDLAVADGVAVLSGWADSHGAALEVHIAKTIGLPVKTVGEWL